MVATLHRTVCNLQAYAFARFTSLPCSYVHAFNIKPEDAAYKALFEDSQGLLIGNIEKLHALLEAPVIERLLTHAGVDGDGWEDAAGAGIIGLPSHDAVAAAAGLWRQRIVALLSATSGFLDRFLAAVKEDRDAFMLARCPGGIRVAVARAGSDSSTGSTRSGRRGAVRRNKSGSTVDPTSASSSRAGSSATVAAAAVGGAGAASAAVAAPSAGR